MLELSTGVEGVDVRGVDGVDGQDEPAVDGKPLKGISGNSPCNTYGGDITFQRKKERKLGNSHFTKIIILNCSSVIQLPLSLLRFSQ